MKDSEVARAVYERLRTMFPIGTVTQRGNTAINVRLDNGSPLFAVGDDLRYRNLVVRIGEIVTIDVDERMYTLGELTCLDARGTRKANMEFIPADARVWKTRSIALDGGEFSEINGEFWPDWPPEEGVRKTQARLELPSWRERSAAFKKTQLPRVTVEFYAPVSEAMGLRRGGAWRRQFMVQCAVRVEEGRGQEEAWGIAEAIRGRFPWGHGADGETWPLDGGGMLDGKLWVDRTEMPQSFPGASKELIQEVIIHLRTYDAPS